MKYIIHNCVCIETDAPEEIVRKAEANEPLSGMVAFNLSRVGFEARELSRLWFSQSKKDIGGGWCIDFNNRGRKWIDSYSIKDGIEYTHDSLRKPTEDAILVFDEIGDFYEA